MPMVAIVGTIFYSFMGLHMRDRSRRAGDT